MRTWTVLLASVLFIASVPAAVLEDFEGAYAGPGTVVADPADAGNMALQLALADNGGGYFVAQVYSLDISALAGSGGTVSMDIYDYGKYFDGSLDGARWGVEGDLNSDAIGLLERSWLGSEAGYAFNTSAYDNQTVTGIRTGSWFSAHFAGGPRQVTALDTDATAAVAGNQGAWTTWSFTVDADGYITEIVRGATVVIGPSTTITGDTGEARHVGSLTTIWASAGRSNIFGLDGLLIDNLAFEGVTPNLHPGDANGDNTVNIQDFIVLKQNYGIATGATWAQGDFDGNGAVNIQDFIILKQNYGWTAAAS